MGGAGDPLPLNLRLGTAYRLFNDRLTLALDGNLPNGNDTYFNIGGEYWIWDLLAARIGYCKDHYFLAKIFILALLF